MKEKSLSHIIRVDASAGSGKTYALAKRYIEILFAHDFSFPEIPLATILAITFTNKAAVEMKERIITILKKIAFDEFPSEEERTDILTCVPKGGKTAQEKASLILDYIMRSYDFFQVQTIDSFINAILKSCSFRTSRSLSFTVMHEYEEYLEYGLDDLIAKSEYDGSLRKSFDEFITHYRYLEPNASWVPRGAIFERIRMLYDITNIYGCLLRESDIRDHDVVSIRRDIVGLMKSLHLAMPDGTKKVVRDKVDVFVNTVGDEFVLSDFSKSFQNAEYPIKKGYDVPPNVQKIWDAIRKKIIGYCEREALSLYNSYIQIFNQSLQCFIDRVVKDDIVFLGELNKEARTLIESDSFNIPELYYRIATRFSHFLIDEFQDTSMLQWQNLSPLIQESLSSGGSLFYVGDTKQAIYGFRGGTAELFNSVPHLLHDYAVEDRALNTNYRSGVAIVECVSDLFSADNLKRFLAAKEESEKDDLTSLREDDLARCLEHFRSVLQEARPGAVVGHVDIQCVEGNVGSVIEESIFDEIKRTITDVIKRSYTYSDIALLVRSNSEAERVTGWCMHNDIPVISDRTLSIKSNVIIQEIISFLTFLESPIDNLAFSSFILGDLFVCATGISRKRIDAFLFERRKRKSDTGGAHPYYIYFRQEFPDEWDFFIGNDFFKKVGITPLYEFVRLICLRYRAFELFPDFQGYIMRLFEFVKEEESQYPNLKAFLDYYESLPNDDAKVYVHLAGRQNAVVVRTYHKSKGLEYPIVLIPFLSLRIRVNNHVLQDVEGEENVSRILHLQKGYAEWSHHLRAAYQYHYGRESIAELNTLYVALTRASEELYVFVPQRIEGVRKNALVHFFPDNRLVRGEKKTKKEKKEVVADTCRHITPEAYVPWMESVRGEFLSIDAIRNRKSIMQGNALHTIFSYIVHVSDENIQAVIARAVEKASSEYPCIKEWEKSIEMVCDIIMHDGIRQFFFTQEECIYTECEIVDGRGNTKRIDRLIVSDDEVKVIDYKSSRVGYEEQCEQVREYMRILREVYPDRKIMGYLIYFDEGSVEEVNV